MNLKPIDYVVGALTFAASFIGLLLGAWILGINR